MPKPHPMVELEYPYGRHKVHIDTMLVPLIQEVWKAGVDTEECCQEFKEGEGQAWVYFPRHNDFLRFMNIVGNPADWQDDTSLYRRMNFPYDGVPDQWEFSIHVEDRHIVERWKKHSSFYLGIGLWFPQTDIDLILARLKDYNDK
jgi:hypothetical protein